MCSPEIWLFCRKFLGLSIASVGIVRNGLSFGEAGRRQAFDEGFLASCHPPPATGLRQVDLDNTAVQLLSLK